MNKQKIREKLKKDITQIASHEPIFGPASALISYGRMFEQFSERPSWLQSGQAKACFRTCAAYALTRDDVFYTEGYAMDPIFPFPIQHAWLADLEGNVFDPTWEDTSDHAYFGISFRKDFVKEMLGRNANECGLLVDPVLMRRNFGSRELIEGAMAFVDQRALSNLHA